jgi:hypothetical protein
VADRTARLARSHQVAKTCERKRCQKAIYAPRLPTESVPPTSFHCATPGTTVGAGGPSVHDAERCRYCHRSQQSCCVDDFPVRPLPRT